MVIREERREREEQKWEARLLILYGLDSLNTYNATSPAGDIVWVRLPEHIQWPFEKRERGEQKWEARLLILYGLDSVNTYNATSPAGDIVWVR